MSLVVRRVLVFTVLWLFFECTISWFATCEPVHQGAAAYGGEQNNCTLFSGPLISIGRFGGFQIAHFLSTYEHELVAGFTIILGFSTVLLWLATKKLWSETRDAASRQETDTKILQRAYISVDGEGISPLISSVLKQSAAHINVKNVGNLPARNVKWFIDTLISENGRLNDFPIDERLFYGKNTVSPGSEMRRSQYFSLNDSEFRNITNGLGILYVWGEIRYLDGFNTLRYTRFCHRYNKHGFLRTVLEPDALLPHSRYELTAESMRYHQFGNDAD